MIGVLKRTGRKTNKSPRRTQKRSQNPEAKEPVQRRRQVRRDGGVRGRGRVVVSVNRASFGWWSSVCSGAGKPWKKKQWRPRPGCCDGMGWDKMMGRDKNVESKYLQTVGGTLQKLPASKQCGWEERYSWRQRAVAFFTQHVTLPPWAAHFECPGRRNGKPGTEQHTATPSVQARIAKMGVRTRDPVGNFPT